MRAISLVGNFADFSSFPHSPTDSLHGSWHVSSPSSAVSSRRTLLHARITKWQKGWGRKGPQEVFCSLVVIPVGGLAWVKANSPLACRPHCRKPKHQELWGAATRFLGNAKACQGRRAKLNLSFLWSRVRHHVSAQGDSSDLGRDLVVSCICCRNGPNHCGEWLVPFMLPSSAWWGVVCWKRPPVAWIKQILEQSQRKLQAEFWLLHGEKRGPISSWSAAKCLGTQPWALPWGFPASEQCKENLSAVRVGYTPQSKRWEFLHKGSWGTGDRKTSRREAAQLWFEA